MRRTREQILTSLLKQLSNKPKTYKEVYQGICDSSTATKMMKILSKRKMVETIVNPNLTNSKLLIITKKGFKELGINPYRDVKKVVTPKMYNDKDLDILNSMGRKWEE